MGVSKHLPYCRFKVHAGNVIKRVYSIEGVHGQPGGRDSGYDHGRSVVSRADNIADLGTRDNASIADVDENSEWQKGASWMYLPIDQWPVSQDTGRVDVPDGELIPNKIVAHVVVNPTRYGLF